MKFSPGRNQGERGKTVEVDLSINRSIGRLTCAKAQPADAVWNCGQHAMILEPAQWNCTDFTNLRAGRSDSIPEKK